MEKIIVTAKFHTGHRQLGYPGKCKFVHGHTWQGKVTIAAEQFPRDHIDMSLEFGEIKNVMRFMDHKMLIVESDKTFMNSEFFEPEGVVVLKGKGPSVENVAYQTRLVQCLDEKRRIASLVAQHIPDEASLFINIGTTTEEVARALLSHRGLRIITNNLNVASIMSQNEDFEVIIAGGVVRSRDQGIVGETTIDFLDQFKVDFGVIGISGIDADGSLLDFDHREVRASKCIIANSRQVFLVADHTKFGRNAMVRLGTLLDLDAFYTDRRPPREIQKLMEKNDIHLFVAEAPETEEAGRAG